MVDKAKQDIAIFNCSFCSFNFSCLKLKMCHGDELSPNIFPDSHKILNLCDNQRTNLDSQLCILTQGPFSSSGSSEYSSALESKNIKKNHPETDELDSHS